MCLFGVTDIAARRVQNRPHRDGETLRADKQANKQLNRQVGEQRYTCKWPGIHMDSSTQNIIKGKGKQTEKDKWTGGQTKAD